jgi:iron-sulfur cluster insertion protein
MSQPISLTPAAIEKIKDLITEENRPGIKLRIYVQGGGCAGFEYGFAWDDEFAEDDWQLDYDGAEVVVDSMSMRYLQGIKVHWAEGLQGSSFEIDNPNANSSCGCGSSFSPM